MFNYLISIISPLNKLTFSSSKVTMAKIVDPNHSVSYPQCGSQDLVDMMKSAVLYDEEERPTASQLLKMKFVNQ